MVFNVPKVARRILQVVATNRKWRFLNDVHMKRRVLSDV
jgi:hypothetical protein